MESEKVIVSELKKRLEEQLKSAFKGLILFGSRARGDAKEDSDYDFLVLVDEASEDVWNVLYKIAGDLLLKFEVVMSLFAVEKKRFKHDKYEPLFMAVRKEGIQIE